MREAHLARGVAQRSLIHAFCKPFHDAVCATACA
jgi:hypothetical protein